MWTVVYMTQNEESANTVGNILSEKKLLYKIRSVGEKYDKDSCFEVLVPETEINEAHNIIIENNLL